jgi:hypothetical protein
VSAEAAESAPAPEEEWVEIYRGPRRRGHVVIRVLTDATIPSRDARRMGLTAVNAREGVVQVPKSRLAEATAQIEMLKKSFPALFVVGAAKGE